VIYPARIIAILPDDRLHIAFQVYDLTVRRVVPRPLDLYPTYGVGDRINVDYTHEGDIERLLYPKAAPFAITAEMVVPVEERHRGRVSYSEQPTEDRKIATFDKKLDGLIREHTQPDVDVAAALLAAAIGVSDTSTPSDVNALREQTCKALGLDSRSTLFEICRAAEDTMASWHAVQRERAELCEMLGLDDDTSAAELRAHVARHMREHVVFAHELALLLRCSPELPAIVAAVRGRVAPDEDAWRRAADQVREALAKMLAEQQELIEAIVRHWVGPVRSGTSFVVLVSVHTYPAREHAAVRALSDFVSRTHRLCPVRLDVLSNNVPMCSVTFPASEAVER
jgi:hypothetical protein